MDLAAAVDVVVARLNAGGVRAAADPRDLNPPAVLVRAPSFTARFGKGGVTYTWEMWALVPDSGTTSALAAISDLITATQTALGFAVVDGRPDNFTLPDGSTPPGYVLTLTETVR